ncbi:MAG: CRISPR-associated endonuclease Cas1 [Bacteroidales bacterium]|nr:CRISPR-associated endonuclease Cas1 [Lachnoclostridium sp.]MCM1383151.1 CRISPR-associated endonuclease Cas1 [Lachnoclostridium sp.]MCM1464623.1 CRISPR-associated endonuclease Cas1 [Bacteroidales bacterium]
MSLLFVNESNALIGTEENRCYVLYADGMKKLVPIETLESITIMGHAQMTTQCVQECLKRGIPVSYFSKGGSYFGRLQSTGHINTERQRKQCALYETEFAIELARNIISAKLKNQIVVLKRYEKSKKASVSEALKMMLICKEKIPYCKSIPKIMGYEGQGAKAYFEGLSVLIEPEFYFSGRSKRPPRDEFNSMISLGYSVLMNELYDKIEVKGLNPYFGFMHRDKEKHPTLASDMMEEWRAVIVDSTVMSIINGHEIHKEDFLTNIDEPGCYLTRSGLKIFLSKLEKKLQTEVRYLPYVDYAVSFRRGIALQMDLLVKAIEAGDATLYKPIEIR